MILTMISGTGYLAAEWENILYHGVARTTSHVIKHGTRRRCIIVKKNDVL